MQNLIVESEKAPKEYRSNSVAYLTESEYNQLVKYKHYAEKTMYEIWMLENVTYWIE